MRALNLVVDPGEAPEGDSGIRGRSEEDAAKGGGTT